MGYLANMTVDGKEYKLRHCNFSLHQNTDQTGRPMTEVIGGMVQFELLTKDDADASLYQWMIDSTHRQEWKNRVQQT